MKESYKRLIRTFPDFPKPGIEFIDWMPVLKDPASFNDLIDDLVALIPNDGKTFTKIAGLESRGFLLGVPIAQRLGAGFVPIRKKGKLPGTCLARSYALEYGTASIEIQADAIGKDDRVLIVDDLLATGGTMRAANKMIENITGEIENLFFLELDDLQGGKLIEHPYRSLIHI